MRKFYIAAVIIGCFILNGLAAKAQSDIYESYAILSLNGGANSYYDLLAATSNPDFNGNNLGNFVVGTSNLILNGSQQKVYKCNTDDITNGQIWYRIYQQSATPGAFTSGAYLSYSFNVSGAGPGCTNQQWEVNNAGINILSGLGIGNYYLEVYTTAHFTYSSGSGEHFANNSGANYKASFSIVPSTNTWLGQTTGWTNTANWSAGTIPTATTNVIIPSVVVSAYPTITTAEKCYNIDIASGATLTLSSTNGAKLSLGGAITNTGLVDATAGTLELNGTAAQTITNSMFKNNTVKNLIISNNASIGGTANIDTLKITGTISFGASSKTLTTNNNLTLISNSAGTASLGDLTAGGLYSGNSVSGNANVERYISSGRKWRFIAINTEGSQTIQNAWMEKQAPGVQGPSGYGEWITDPSAANVDGLSYTPSMKYYSSGTYASITDPTTFNIKSQAAYMTYIRGDRSATHLNSTVNETVLRTYGTLTQGQKVMNVPAGTGTFAVIANPYASAIDLKQLTYSNTGNIDIYVWDPKLGGAYTLGGYQVISRSSPGADFRISSPGGGSYGGVGSPMNTIESGLAFYIKGTASAQTVTMNEIAKTASLNNVFFTASQPKDIYSLLSVKDASGTTLIDGANASFDADFSNSVDDDDAIKLPNISENVSFKRYNTLLAIERRRMPVADDTLFLNLTGLGIKNYQWNIKLSNLDAPGLTAFVKDSYLNTTIPLNLNGDNITDFSVNADPGSYAANRFMIVLKPTAVVPVAMQIVSAERQADKTVKVVWKAGHETSLLRYEAERSSNGSIFMKAGEVGAANHTLYSFIDMQPLNGANYYRIKAISADGAAAYTEILKVAALSRGNMISVSPNPVKSKAIHLRLDDVPAGTYNLQLISANGAVVYVQQLTVSGNVFTKDILPGNQLAAGSYTLVLSGNDDKKMTVNVIIE